MQQRTTPAPHGSHHDRAVPIATGPQMTPANGLGLALWAGISSGLSTFCPAYAELG